MEGLIELHDSIMFYLIIILFGVGWILASVIRNYSAIKSPISHKYLNHGTLIELIWTITPALVLILIAFPSFKLLYLMDEVNDPAMTILAEGFFYGGPKSYYLNKIEDTCYLTLLIGQRKITLFINKFHFYSQNFHTRMKAGSRIGPHNLDVISILIGSLLGDCYGNNRSGEGTRFAFKQSILHKEYLFWLYNFFYSRGYCSNLEPRLYKRKLNRNGVVKEYYGYEFNTFTFRSFNWIYYMFYKKGIKVINPDLEKYLTPLALAVWLCDDGGWAKPGVRIATNSYNLKEVIFLANILKNKFDLVCTIQKIGIVDKYSLYIIGYSVPALRTLVLPYMPSCMHYKLGL